MERNMMVAASADHLSIVSKTNYKKIKPDLKRHYPEMWGRFLDNHYDPQHHQRPFVVAMKTPEQKYKYSQGVGLSFKFTNKNVLERLDVDKQSQQKQNFVRFEEFASVREGEVMVSIEHCINCHQHNTSTKHDEEKYKQFALQIQGAIKEQFPLVKVIIKPISTEQDQKVKKLKIEGSGDKPTVIDTQIKNLRLGAFEVQIFTKSGGKPVEKIIHSKLQSGLWPSISQILEKIHYYLPRIPKLCIQLFKDMNSQIEGHDSDQEDQPNFKDLQITLKSTYSGTTSQMQLSNYLDSCESHRLQIQMLKKNRRIIEKNRSIRPSTASSHQVLMQSPSRQINMLLQSQSSFRHRNLQSIQSQHMIRPSSASTYFMQNQQRSTDNTSALTTINNVPSRGHQIIQDNYGLMQQQQRPISAISAKTDIPRLARPFSAQSRKSGINQSAKKTISYIDKVDGAIKRGRGLGFFGDDNDKIQEQKLNKETEGKLRVREQQTKTDKDGKALISQIPVGIYSIEVQGNEEFLPSRRDINIVNDEDKDELVIYVAMKPRINSSIEFSILSQAASGQKQKLKPEGTNIKAILLPSFPGQQSQDKELEDYEFEVLWDSDKNVWQSDLPNGNYLLNVKAAGHAEQNSYVEVRNGRRSFEVICLQKAASVYSIKIKAVNIQTGKHVQNVFVQMYKSTSQQPEEAITMKDGVASFSIKEISTIIITSSKTGYANLARKFDITQGLLHSSPNKEVSIMLPMIKDSPQDSTSAFAILTYAGLPKDIQLLALPCSEGQKLEVKNIESSIIQVCKFDTSQMACNNIFDESVDKSMSQGKDKKPNTSIRFMATIRTAEFLQPDPRRIDSFLRNPLQDTNLQFSIVYRDNTTNDSNGEYVMRTFDAPAYVNPNSPHWDICFFTYPYIIESNAMVQQVPTNPDRFFSYYTKLSVFLKNRKGMRFNDTLGFDSDGTFRMDDTFLDPGTFENLLANSLIGADSQKLWSHDQKKTLQRYYLKKETEDKVLAIHEDLGVFYNHFTQSMMNMFGKVSLRRFTDFIQRL